MILIVDIDEQMREEERKKGKKGEKKRRKKRKKKRERNPYQVPIGSILHRNTVYMEHHGTAAIGIQYITKKKKGKGKEGHRRVI